MTFIPPWLQPSLQALQAARSHALLLHGASGLGQWPLGQALAAAALCENPKPDASACGQCAACQLLANYSHPDCYYLLPETLLLDWGLPLDEKRQKELDEKKRKPSKIIGIDAVRDTVEKLQQTSARARGQVVLAYPAEAMTLEAANAFLKTLEEPLGQVRIILMSENAHRLLPTIRSRCLGAAMPWPAQDAALAWLQTQLPKTPVAQLQTALQAAGGRAWDAVAWLDSPLAGRWPSLPRALAQGQVAALADCSPKQAVDALQKLAHDLWAVKVHAAPRYFQAADLPRPPSAQALLAWGQQLLVWARSIEHPYKTDLLLEDMVAQTAVLWKSTGQRGGKSLR
jgi:DNA polymerase-3 subunit delta'